MNDQIRPITVDDLLRLASRVSIPDVANDERTVCAGQLWVARWDTFRELVLVAQADASLPVVVPVTFDDTHELNGPEHVQSGALGDGRAHWGAPRAIPAITLGSLIESDVRIAHTLPQASANDTRAKELWDGLDAFDEGGNGLLPARLKAVGTTPSQLARQLGVSVGQALDLFRGRLVPTPPMAYSIAELLGISPAAVFGLLEAIPTGLRRDLSKRRFRNAVRAQARKWDWSDSTAWKQIAFGTLAMAYRTTGGHTDEDWEPRIERYLEVDNDH
ncbi:hypothetical protein BOH66_16135 [Microbacterium aurum]|uniref:HTH cro/C1-type domain-containing protein n=1 Tax=Microbacterium aurum TaxID=36805 RepID=A0A1P8UBR8_9MICO|nr:helix-turn-helix transcriptional regulator [Microbacterium aurum]APZ35587.1 hypothetical protein BOH66_16135 [Microbacterium aurum]MBM7826307.1 transcriptional regulator with XRE-family HTH domain [Microbacterium aurum]